MDRSDIYTAPTNDTVEEPWTLPVVLEEATTATNESRKSDPPETMLEDDDYHSTENEDNHTTDNEDEEYSNHAYFDMEQQQQQQMERHAPNDQRVMVPPCLPSGSTINAKNTLDSHSVVEVVESDDVYTHSYTRHGGNDTSLSTMTTATPMLDVAPPPLSNYEGVSNSYDSHPQYMHHAHLTTPVHVMEGRTVLAVPADETPHAAYHDPRDVEDHAYPRDLEHAAYSRDSAGARLFQPASSSQGPLPSQSVRSASLTTPQPPPTRPHLSTPLPHMDSANRPMEDMSSTKPTTDTPDLTHVTVRQFAAAKLDQWGVSAVWHAVMSRVRQWGVYNVVAATTAVIIIVVLTSLLIATR